MASIFSSYARLGVFEVFEVSPFLYNLCFESVVDYRCSFK
jgi:hypothetical protein